MNGGQILLGELFYYNKKCHEYKWGGGNLKFTEQVC